MEGAVQKITEKETPQWTMEESYKVNNLFSRETAHLTAQLSLPSQSMKDVFISIPITRLRFISITWAGSLESANCSASVRGISKAAKECLMVF